MSNAAPDMFERNQEADAKLPKKAKPNYVFYLASAWLVIVVFFTLFGQWMPFIDDPFERNADKINAEPSWRHPFGNTTLGQDILAQVIEGAKVSMRVATIGTGVGIIVGGLMGLVAGYLRGWVDAVVRLIINATLSVPALLMVIFIVAVKDQSEFTVIIAICVLAIPALARIVRASALQVSEREFVKAAEVVGAKKFSILFREVLPNVMPTLVSFAFLTTGIILVAESSLSFLGLSVEAPAITWGSIIRAGSVKFADVPHMVFMPAIVLFLTVLSLNFVGDQLLKRFDIKESAL